MVEEIKCVHVFQVGMRTIVGICEVEEVFNDGSNIDTIETMGEMEGIHQEYVSDDTIVISVKNPALLLEFIVASEIDPNQQSLAHQIKPFFGKPEFLNININSIDFHYVITDEKLVSKYLEVTNSFMQENKNEKKIYN